MVPDYQCQFAQARNARFICTNKKIPVSDKLIHPNKRILTKNSEKRRYPIE